jgi:hypothetical protein
MEIVYNSQEEADKKRLYQVLKHLKSGVYKINIQKIKDSRSLNQNKYYWAVVVSILASEVGYFKDEMHTLLRRKFLGYTRTNPVTGEEEMFAKSTTDLNTQEMEQYLESIRVWAISELDVYIPLPNEFGSV